MDQLGSLSQNHNPDHRYITKILLASGLLKDVDSVSTAIQLQSSGHMIDPRLFHILEQTEGVLCQKMDTGRDRLSAQQLQKELKSDIDKLNDKKVSMDSEEDELISILNADLRYQSDDWTNGESEIPSLILRCRA
ncbi:hypothetical protein HAX54_039661 [Datura stramonium]|uniref:DUF4378 domain-containing protein n=1 Tax=Datura stramonium TaxID=4076 RepID=A0ABS8SJI5_DATST|nr:hypothetical protein [Datura stramonium]